MSPELRPPAVVLITGIMGAGKSSVAQALAERLPKSAHVRGDAFRRFIVGGAEPMLPGAGPEALEQLRLRYRLGAATADTYAGAGFVAVYQDIILGQDLVSVVSAIRTRPLFVVVLNPGADVVSERAETRAKVSGYGDWTVEALHELLLATPRIGLWVDTSHQTVNETVTAILTRLDDARVGQ